MQNSIEIAILANIQSLTAGMNEATAKITQSVEKMSAELTKMSTHAKQASTDSQSAIAKMGSGISKGIGAIQGSFVQLGAILAGGAFFKDVVKGSMDWNLEAMKLARVLGITTEKASILNLALGDIYSSSEVYTKSVMMMTRGINSGGKGMEALGVSARDTNGKLKPSGDIMEEVLGKLGKLKAGTDRNTAGAAIFGRGWVEASKLVKLSGEAMSEAEKKAKSLGLVVGEEGVAQAEAYRAAMHEVDDVFTALKVQLGTSLIPILTQLGGWMGQNGPAEVGILGEAIQWVTRIFLVLKMIIEDIVIIDVALFMTLINGFKMVGAVAYAVLTGNFREAVNIGKQAATDIKNEWLAAAEGISQGWEKMTEAGARVLVPDKKKPKGDGGAKGGDDFGGVDTVSGKTSKITTAWTKEYDTLKAMEEMNHSWSLDKEKEFWEKKAKTATKGTELWTFAQSKVNDIAAKIEENRVTSEKAAFELSMAAAKNNSAARVSLAQDYRDKMLKDHGNTNKLFLDADKQLEEEKVKHTERMAEIAREGVNNTLDVTLASIDLEEAAYEQLAEAGNISRMSQLAKEKTFEDKRYQAKVASIKALAALEPDATKQALLLKKLETAELAHNTKMTQIDTKGIKDRAKVFDNFYKGMTAGFSSAIQGLIKGTMTWGNAFKSVVGTALDFIINFYVEWGLEAVATSIKSMLAHSTASKAAIRENVAEAGTAGMKSAAAIPFYGWAIAIGAGLAIFAAASSISSAAGGWGDIPHDQVAQVHKNEMILPAVLANKVRNMADGGGKGSTIQISTFDAKGVRAFLGKSGNQRAMGQAASAYVKKGGKI